MREVLLQGRSTIGNTKSNLARVRERSRVLPCTAVAPSALRWSLGLCVADRTRGGVTGSRTHTCGLHQLGAASQPRRRALIGGKKDYRRTRVLSSVTLPLSRTTPSRAYGPACGSKPPVCGDCVRSAPRRVRAGGRNSGSAPMSKLWSLSTTCGGPGTPPPRLNQPPSV